MHSVLAFSSAETLKAQSSFSGVMCTVFVPSFAVILNSCCSAAVWSCETPIFPAAALGVSSGVPTTPCGPWRGGITIAGAWCRPGSNQLSCIVAHSCASPCSILEKFAAALPQ